MTINDNQLMALQFKTNMKCGGCEAKATPFLNDALGAGNWQLDTTVPEKRLTVTNPNVTVESVRQTVEKAGFKAEILP
jgi:copper chaperone